MERRLPPAIRTAVHAYQAALRECFGDRVCAVRVFGSYAWGEPNESSDVDVYVEMDTVTHRERAQAFDLAAEAGAGRVNLAPLVWDTPQRRRYLSLELGLAVDIMARGLAA